MKRIRKRKAESEKRRSHRGPSDNGSGNGSTLVEVLASILALAIGVTMVATLYPVSILRSINATRLTRGTIHRYNAEAWIDVFTDQLVYNPDLVPSTNLPAHSPRKHYDPANPGAQGGYEGNNYIVDPIGWELIRRDNDGAAAPFTNANQFGAGGWQGGGLQRYNGLNDRQMPLTAAQFAIARQVAEAPDSWVEPLKGEFTVTGTGSMGGPPPTSWYVDITGPSTGDMQSLASQLGGTEPPLTRVIVLDADNKFSHARTISSISPDTPAAGTHRITWTTGGGLPATGFTPATARIQTQERQFTWMLTVRNRSEIGAPDIKKANVDVVVFFRRQYSTAVENTAWTFSGGGLVYTVQSPTGGPLPLPPGTPRPFLKRGAWMCDTINARWYRIQRVLNEDTATPKIVLETSPPAGETLTRGVILPTVVEVYTLGTKQ
jgi:hypothetical protein